MHFFEKKSSNYFVNSKKVRNFAPVKPINLFINQQKVTTMLLGFYPVTSDYERHSFDDSTPEEIVKALIKLDHFHIYNVSETGYQTKINSLTDLMEDFNDELLDCGWWSIEIDMTEDEYINIVMH